MPAKALPDPDGKPADMSKPVRVFIIMGQSNTLEMGKVKGDNEGSLEHAVRKENSIPLWSMAVKLDQTHGRRNAYSGSGGPDGRGGVRRNDWLTVSFQNRY